MTADHLVIMFHGIGGSGAQLEPLAASWQRHLPKARFLTPDAPYRTSYGGHQWFKVDGLQFDPVRVVEVQQALDRIIADALKREGFADHLDRVAFVGVSQGAIVALDAVASGRWKVGALVAFAGLLPLTSLSTRDNTSQMLLVHGTDDRTIPPIASTSAARKLFDAGFSVELEIEPNVGHTISLTGAEKALGFLQRTLAGSTTR
ncbi:alpha/beta hydrolase [Pararhizobium arenae]|uniref:alpha/beta hydrolase n=1 Tax=Pararhizobium arenae TaxID=1856850 RepID=UPI00094AD3B4|nr:prolyl oligopeptidase family serine peptidase [Pararhizobium arenae]